MSPTEPLKYTLSMEDVSNFPLYVDVIDLALYHLITKGFNQLLTYLIGFIADRATEVWILYLAVFHDL
jgi:hypothetical protein